MPLIEIKLSQADLTLEARHFRVQEGISELFEASVLARSADQDLDLESIVGSGAVLTVLGGGASQSPSQGWAGVVRDIAQTETEDSRLGLSTYELELVPNLWLLTQRTNNRLFQHISIVDIVRTLLDEWGLQAEWLIDRDLYPKLELRTQFGESDYAFFSRLLEEAGICFYFRRAQEPGPQLVLDDAPQTRSRRAGKPLPYLAETFQADNAEVEYLTKVRFGVAVRSGRMTMRDYDYRRPHFELFSDVTAAAGPESDYEQYRYRPGGFLAEAASREGTTPVSDDLGTARFETSVGSRLAQVALESLRGTKRRLQMQTNAFDLRPGTVFHMSGHPRTDLGEDKRMLVTRSAFEGDVTEEWSIVIDPRLAAEPYRPPQLTPKPRVTGVQSAVIVGPEGEEIYVDEFGRVRVQFHWDRINQNGPESSIWMRVSQGWAGTRWGMFCLPRIGHEVLVTFLDGDVDNPVVTGRVHNGVNQTPYPLPEHKTVSTWKSDSTKGSNGYNEIKYEDKKHRELFFEHAQKDRASVVRNDEVAFVGRDRTRMVEHDELLSVRHDRIRVVQHDERVAIGHDRTHQVRRDEAIAVGRDLTQFVLRDQLQSIAQNERRSVGLNRRTAVGGSDVARVGNRFEVTVTPGLAEAMAEAQRGPLDGTPGTMLGPAEPASDPDALGSGKLSGLSGLLQTTSMAETPTEEVLRQPLGGLDPFMPGSPEAVVDLARVSSERSEQEGAAHEAKEAGQIPPTRIEMQNRRIRFTTGQATLTLDGPDIRLEASGTITLVSDQLLKIKSVADDVVVLGGPVVQLNPDDDDDDEPLPGGASTSLVGGSPSANPALVAPTRAPSNEELRGLRALLEAKEYDQAVEQTFTLYGIDPTPIRSVQVEPALGAGANAMVSRAGDVSLGESVFSSPSTLASALVHVATRAKQTKLRRTHRAERPASPAQAAHYDGAVAYQAELLAAESTGLSQDAAALRHVEEQFDREHSSLSEEGQEQFRQGAYPW